MPSEWCYGHSKPLESNGSCRICNQEAASVVRKESRPMDKKFMFNIKWTSPRGKNLSLTDQSDDLAELVEEASQAMLALQVDDEPSGNGNNSNGTGELWCKEHQQQWTRWEKGNQAWYSHPLGDGKFCKPPKQEASRY